MGTDHTHSTWALFEYVGGPRDGELTANTAHSASLDDTYMPRSNPPHLGALAGWKKAVDRASAAFGQGVPDTYIRMIWDDEGAPMSTDGPADLARTASQVDRLLQALRSGEDYEARLIASAFCAHTPSKTDLIESVLAPAMRIIGQHYADGNEPLYVLSRASAIVHGILGDHSAASTHVIGQRVAVATATGEAHSLPARMAAVALREDGWQVEEFVGPLPPQELVDAAVASQLDLVVLSVTTAGALPAAQEVEQLLKPAGIPVIIGTLNHSLYELQRLARRVSLAAAS